MSELTLHRLHDLVQVREIAIVQAPAARQLPNALDRVQFRAVGGERIEPEVMDVFFPPLAVQARMVVFGVVGNDHHAPDSKRECLPKCSGTGLPQQQVGQDEECAHPHSPRSLTPGRAIHQEE